MVGITLDVMRFFASSRITNLSIAQTVFPKALVVIAFRLQYIRWHADAPIVEARKFVSAAAIRGKMGCPTDLGNKLFSRASSFPEGAP